jgi:hypothetical protein
MRGTVQAKRARAAGLPQRLKRCVAMGCDAQRRMVERCDAPRRVALPTVMSISPTRLIDARNMRSLTNGLPPGPMSAPGGSGRAARKEEVRV